MFISFQKLFPFVSLKTPYEYAPAYKSPLEFISMSIISLLSDPNPDSPLNGEAAALYKNGKTSKEDRRKYTKMILSVGDKNIKKN